MISKKLFLIPFFLLAVAPTVFAQEVFGSVEDYRKDPIFGAFVSLKGTENHTHTDEFGNFKLSGVKINDTLSISLLGFKTTEAVVSDFDKGIQVKLEDQVFDLGEVVVSQTTKELNVVSTIDLRVLPVQSSQEILRKVPGLFIGQHAGGGKAEQIFLRGFDIDHGTDVNITVDGMPVNMVSHAHGQGYADLHFLIPETVQSIDYGKGPYYSQVGNFGTAGYVQFLTKDQLDNSEIKMEAGRFNTFRTVGMFKLLDEERHDAYLVSEYLISDGPFESSQNFNRLNFMGKYHARLNNGGRLSLLASHFSSEWDASGQIPVRAVESGLISNFGAIDDTEGGNTSRTNIALRYDRILNNNTFIKNSFYYSLYDFELFSNFTFFLEDPENGDQIRQVEERRLFGVESSLNYTTSIGGAATILQFGAGLRSDLVQGNELARTLNRRTTLSRIQSGDVDERNLYGFLDVEIDAGQWLIKPALRFDYFQFNYLDDLATLYDPQGQTATAFSPKLSVIYNLNDDVQLFAKTGIGFHSNDTRVVLEQGNEAIVPAAYGADLGTIFKPAKRLIANLALWYLFLEQEFVYVGDAGIVEPSGETRRLGVDFSLRYQLGDYLFLNGDVNYAYARSIEDPEGQDRIPLAPELTAMGGLSYRRNGLSTALQVRHLQDRPANEDNSIVAEGYTIVDLNANYDFRNLSLGFSIENLFDVDWKETQFATESRLRDEPTSVEEIHFTPGFPFFLKGIVRYRF